MNVEDVTGDARKIQQAGIFSNRVSLFCGSLFFVFPIVSNSSDAFWRTKAESPVIFSGDATKQPLATLIMLKGPEIM